MLAEFLLDMIVVCACAAAAVLAAHAVRLQGAAAMGVAAAAGAVVVIQMTGGGLQEIGLRGPPDLEERAPLIAAGLAACYAVAGLASLILTKVGLGPDVTRLDFVKGNLPALLLMLAISWTTAAFGEEIVFRGFLLNRAAGLDTGIENWILIALLAQAVLFGLAHAYQGLGGMIVTGLLGLTLGLLTLLADGDLWPAIIVHGLINTVSLTAIYASRPQAAAGNIKT